MTGFGNNPGPPAEKPEGPGTGAKLPPSADPPSQSRETDEANESQGVRFRDKRRIDPETYEPRPQEADAGAQGEGRPQSSEIPDAESVAALEELFDTDERISELTADLKRLSAEYANYRRRVDRDRTLQAELTTASVMTKLLPILDDLARAREHGELQGGFKSVGEAIETFTHDSGLTAFGAEGEPFDPNFHEAMTSDTSADVQEPTITRVYQVGYRIGDRVLRAARVGVTDAE